VRLLLKQLQATSVGLSPEQRQLIDGTGIVRCAATVTALSTLVKETQQKSSGQGSTRAHLRAALKWLVSRSDAEKLVDKMEQHMQDLSVSLVLINLYVLSMSTARRLLIAGNHSEVTAEIRDVGIGTRNSIQNLEPTVLDHRAAEMARTVTVQVRSVTPSRRAQQAKKQLALYGQVLMPDVPYSRLRQKFSDAAYFGNWKVLLKLLEEAERVYRQWWINCARPGTYSPQGNRILGTDVG
jgi:hypothetical protein